MDGKTFISDVEENLVPLSPIIAFVIKKQLAEIGATPEDLTPKDAMKFIDKMAEAMDMFLGKSESVKSRTLMMGLLRKQAPEFFENQSLI